MSKSKQPNYQQPPAIDCAAAVNRVEIIPRGMPVSSINVRELAVITKVQIHLGQRGDGITLRQGEGIEAEPGAAFEDGVFFSCAAGGGGALATLLAVFGESPRIEVTPS